MKADAHKLYGTRSSFEIFLLTMLVWGTHIFAARSAYRNRFSKIGRTSRFEIAYIAIMAYLWSDLGSTISHIVLDNPSLRKAPKFLFFDIAEHARIFQAHHRSPITITMAPWMSYLAELHDIVIFQGVVCIVITFKLIRSVPSAKPKDPRQMSIAFQYALFCIFCMVFHHLSLASHRWAHEGSRDIGLLPYTLQVSGILMTSSHHARHHVTFDTNFCFLGGWSDASSMLYFL